jgi:hypothetical protein
MCAPTLEILEMKRLLLLVATLLLATTVIAQGMPGGGGRSRGGGGREGNSQKRPDQAQPTTPTSAANSDSISTLYQELPSLKVDLKLNAEQTRLWDAFALRVRDVRDVMQGRIRREMSVRIKSPEARAALEKDPPPATSLFNTLADEDRQRADAMEEARVKAAALIASLTPEQKKMFDRRIALSQADPLGAY